jgi:hypothetical protein
VLIDGALPGDRNVIKKGAEKILKYKDLKIEIQRMWNIKANSRGNWNCLRICRKYLSNIPEKHEV